MTYTCHDPGDRGGGRACDTCGIPTERYVVLNPDGSAYRSRGRSAGTRHVPRCSGCRLMWRIAARSCPPRMTEDAGALSAELFRLRAETSAAREAHQRHLDHAREIVVNLQRPVWIESLPHWFRVMIDPNTEEVFTALQTIRRRSENVLEALRDRRRILEHKEYVLKNASLGGDSCLEDLQFLRRLLEDRS